MTHSGKFTPVRLATLLANLKIGMPPNQAAAQAGISMVTLKRWIDEEEGVAEQVMQAEADFTYKHVKNLDEIAMSDAKNAASVSQWLLERRDPATWGRSTRNDMWTREQLVRAMAEELRREGLDITDEQVFKEISDAEKRALPGGKK